MPGVQLYLQPVQDLTLDASVSRTQYQFVLENPNLSAFNEWVPKLLAQMQKSPDLTDVASDLEQQALDVDLVIDRRAPPATASRRRRWTTRCTTCSASASSPPSTRSPTSTA